MPDFVLNHDPYGKLGGGTFSTDAFRMSGSFREIQFSFLQSGLGQDAQPHYFEFHFTPIGIVEATGTL